jgi:hypothetical protein
MRPGRQGGDTLRSGSGCPTSGAHLKRRFSGGCRHPTSPPVTALTRIAPISAAFPRDRNARGDERRVAQQRPLLGGRRRYRDLLAERSHRVRLAAIGSVCRCGDINPRPPAESLPLRAWETIPHHHPFVTPRRPGAHRAAARTNHRCLSDCNCLNARNGGTMGPGLPPG